MALLSSKVHYDGYHDEEQSYGYRDELIIAIQSPQW